VRNKLSSAFDLQFRGNKSSGNSYMIPDAIITSRVGAKCATKYNISELKRSDSIATMRAASVKYSDWSFRSDANFT